MTGIYYASPNPTSPPFVTEGEMVNMGQVVGLIEAMKVFNEIIAPVSGIVSKVVAKNGEVVNPGEPLLYIG
jgi:acetyl-CoA carboxylase biotin carboxyl carrier protein